MRSCGGTRQKSRIEALAEGELEPAPTQVWRAIAIDDQDDKTPIAAGAGAWISVMAGEREAWKADLERRERDVATREAALAERMEAAQVILDAAAKRDVTADGRTLPPKGAGMPLIELSSWLRTLHTGTATIGPIAAMPVLTATIRRLIARHRLQIGLR